jgi:DNA replication and repair protein RecF
VHLTRLALTDFRSYREADLTLAPGVTTMLGANGQGKTNLVEAVAYLATLGSHRVASDAPLVRSGAERAIIRAAVCSAERDSLVEIEVNPGRANRARVNRVPVPRPRQVLGILRTVMFAPEDLALVKGDPEQRRRYLDDLLVVSAPRYAAVRSDYDRVVKQRTALLKSARARSGPRGYGAQRAGRGGRPHGPPEDTDPGDAPGMGLTGALDAWDEHLAVKGAELVTGRIRLTNSLKPLVEAAYEAVSGQDGATLIGYRQRGFGAEPERSSPPVDVDPGLLAENLRKALAASRADEIERGMCLVGPHRDDLSLRIGELPARGYASHGESWSMALSLRLASYDLLRSGGDDPVLLLDDVFAELDAGRRDRLARLVANAEQVLVTGAAVEDIPARLDGTRYEVASGVITRAG